MANTLGFSATRCPAQDTLLAFSQGKLTEAELGTIGLHLEVCETCLAFLDSQEAQPAESSGFLRVQPAPASLDSSRSSLLDDTAFEKIRGDAEFQRMRAKAKAIEAGDTGDTATWSPSSASPEPAAEALPEKIGRYFVLKKLGRGGFANVFLARDPDQNRLVAIKVPRPEKFKHPSQVDDFLREARTAATLEHPHIVPVFDFDRLPSGSCYVVMKYIEGRSLEAAMASEKITNEQAARLCEQIADALEYAHQKKFVHRDIKPANILLDTGNHPLIADFGLAIHEENQSDRRGEYAGTLRYMSPEQVKGRAHHLDGRTDVWSLGVMFYELLTRERPFPGKTAIELEDEILNRAPKSPRSIQRDLPEDLERVVLRCLEKKVEERCPSAAEVASSLRSYLQSRQRPRWRGATAVVAAAVVLIAVLVGVAFFNFPSWQPAGSAEPSGKTPQQGAPAPATTVENPKGFLPLLEVEPTMVFGNPAADPIYDPVQRLYSVTSEKTQRWIARVYRGPSQGVHLRGQLGLKNWVGKIGFAWQVRDRHDRQSDNSRWMIVEIYRLEEHEPLKIMVRKIVLSAGNSGSGEILKQIKIATPLKPTANLDLVIERGLLRLTFDEQPTIDLEALKIHVNNLLDEGELSVALTGEGDRATFQDVQLELLPTEK